jgi:hypothetical protein
VACLLWNFAPPPWYYSAQHTHTMRCSQFLEIYSDYRDGLIMDPRVEGEIRRHLRDCRRCMNYDASISRGVMALRATSDIHPSRSIHGGFDHRLACAQDELSQLDGVRTAHAGVMVGLMTVAAVALLLGTSVGTEEPRPMPQVTTATAAPPFLTVANDGRPVNLTDTSVPAFGRELPSDSDQQVSFDRWVSLAH